MAKVNGKFSEAVLAYVNSLLPQKDQCRQVEDLSTGIIFMIILKTAQGFKFQFGEMRENPRNWYQNLANIRTIVKKIENYFDAKLNKGIKTKDVNLVEIAYSKNSSEILKMFEMVLSVLIEAPNREEHITKIMNLGQKYQPIFVELSQSIIETRITQFNESNQDKAGFLLDQLQSQNMLFRQQIHLMCEEKQNQMKELEELKTRLKISEDENNQQNNKSIDFDAEELNMNTMIHNDQLKILVENLKKKLITITRQHEVEVMRLREQISNLQQKNCRLQKFEQVCELYKEKYHESESLIEKAKDWEKQKFKLLRTIDEKGIVIKKIEQKMDHLVEQNCALQEREIYLLIELQKRQIRFKQLEKEVKRRITIGDQSVFSISDKGKNDLSNSIVEVMNESQKQQMEEMKEELQKVRAQERQNSRENYRLKREAQKQVNFKKQKKKLEGIILELSKQKKEQLQILISILYETNKENQKYLKLLMENNIKIE